MLSLRQQARVLGRLVQLAQCPRPPAASALLSSSSASAAPTWLHAVVRHRWGGGGGEGGGGSQGGGGITGWLASKLPGMLGGGGNMEDLDLETFGTSLKRARQLGGLTGFAHGTTAASDGQAQGTLRLFEQIIDAMQPEEKKDLQLFDAAARQRVAMQVGASMQQVDDCIARYLWTRQMTRKLAELKREGKEMPQSVDEVEKVLGTWRQYKSDMAGVEGAVPLDYVGPRGERCALAGVPAGKNTRCPATKKAFKACCGRKLKLAG